MVFPAESDDNRVLIRNKASGTKLVFKELLTSDSGEYRCEASNGVMRIVSTAELKVSFSKFFFNSFSEAQIAKCDQFVMKL